MSKLKAPRKGAVAQMRELYKKLREETKPTMEELNRLREVFKKKERVPAEKTPRKIAKPSRDAELP